jgi:hypothetical protein|nr:MAG TPA: hypothetical protein [Caudoviricetes sp.]
MEDKTQYEALVEELQKIVENFKVGFTEIGEILSKLLPDEEEDTWEMKCPYEYGDNHYCIQSSGDVFLDSWKDIEADNSFFSQGNIFPTREAAELEAKRRNLLTRFRAYRDECNGGWKPDWSSQDKKWEIDCDYQGLKPLWINKVNGFPTFGHFENEEDCKRAIELFGDEIKELFVDCEV